MSENSSQVLASRMAIDALIEFLETGRKAMEGTDEELASIWSNLTREIDTSICDLPSMEKLGKHLEEF